MSINTTANNNNDLIRENVASKINKMILTITKIIILIIEIIIMMQAIIMLVHIIMNVIKCMIMEIYAW